MNRVASIIPTIVLGNAGAGTWVLPKPKVVITNGLRASWPLIDFDGGISGQDVSGFNNPLGIATNPPTYSTLSPITGRQGCAEFDGVATRATRSFSPFFDSVSEWSLLVWVRLKTASSSQVIAFCYRPSPAGIWWELLFDATTNRLKYRFKDSRSGTVKSIVGPSIQVGQWWLVAVRNNYQTNEAALSAKSASNTDPAWASWYTSAASILFTPSPGNFRVGFPGSEGAFLEGGFLSGYLYSLNIWDRVLADSEILWFAQNWQKPWDPDLVPPPEGWNQYETPEMVVDFAASGPGPVTLTWDNNGSGQFQTEIVRAEIDGESFAKVYTVNGGAAASMGSFTDPTGNLEHWWKARHVGLGRPSDFSPAVRVAYPAPAISYFYQNNGDVSISFTHPSNTSAAWGDYFFIEYQINGGGWIPDPDSPWPRTTTSLGLPITGASSAGGELWEVRIRARKGNRYSDWSAFSLTSDPF